MELQCNNNVIPLFESWPKSDESPQFSISLPLEAIEMIENGLIPFSLYGKKRTTVCRALILDMLKQPSVQEHIREGRAKAK